MRSKLSKSFIPAFIPTEFDGECEMPTQFKPTLEANLDELKRAVSLRNAEEDIPSQKEITQLIRRLQPAFDQHPEWTVGDAVSNGY